MSSFLKATAMYFSNLFKVLKGLLNIVPLLILIWILFKGALAALSVALMITGLKMTLAFITATNGESWVIKYLEIIHDIFSLLIFMISCFLDLKEYLRSHNKNNSEGSRRSTKKIR